jgi:hypothetical protein
LVQVCLHPSCPPQQHEPSALSRRHLLGGAPPIRATSVALLQGSSLRSRLCCPGPSSLNRPHPSHSQAHHNFIARRFICDAFAVRERLGDPRAVPGFHCAFHPDMPSPETPGSSTSNSSRQRCRHRPSPSSDRLGTPKIPAIRFAQGVHFVAYTVHTFATACQVACPPVRIRPASRPSGTFTTRLPTGRSPFPLLVITTTATGLEETYPLGWGHNDPGSASEPGRAGADFAG